MNWNEKIEPGSVYLTGAQVKETEETIERLRENICTMRQNPIKDEFCGVKYSVYANEIMQMSAQADYLSRLLKNAEQTASRLCTDYVESDEIDIGSTVQFHFIRFDQDGHLKLGDLWKGEVVHYDGKTCSNPPRVSVKSPLGQAILGHRKYEVIFVKGINSDWNSWIWIVDVDNKAKRTVSSNSNKVLEKNRSSI